jgi:hypothetical protein
MVIHFTHKMVIATNKKTEGKHECYSRRHIVVAFKG